MTSPFPGGTIWRLRTDPGGKRFAYARGRADIPFIPELPPDPLLVTDRVPRIRTRSFPPVGAPSRSTLVYGSYTADIPVHPTNYVGVTPGTVLTRHPASGDGDFYASANNQVIQALDVYGCVRVGTYSGVTIKNCIIRGGTGTAPNNGLVQGGNLIPPGGAPAGGSLRGAVIQDCTFTGRGNLWQGGIGSAGDYTLERCEITGFADGVSLNSSIGKVNLFGNWIHNGLYAEWAVDGDPNYPAQSAHHMHGDAVQFHTGKDIVLRGNYLGGKKLTGYDYGTGANAAAINANDDFHTSAVMLQQEIDASLPRKIERVMIEKNYLEGGMGTLNIPSKYSNNMASVTIRDNTFPRQTFVVPVSTMTYVGRMAEWAGVWSNNRFDDGTPVAINQKV